MADGGANALGAAVRRAREALHLSQAELAARAGVSLQTVSRVERGQTVAADSVRALAAALGIDAADLPRRPVRSAMPDVGETDPHWRDFLAAVGDAGEKALASGRPERGRYLAMAAPTRPTVETLLPPMLPEAWAAISCMAWMGSFCLAIMVEFSVDARDERLQVITLLVTALASACLLASGLKAHGMHRPGWTHDDAMEAMSSALDAERHLVTDRAAYVATRSGQGTYSWRRMALPAAIVRHEPVDAIVPDLASLILEDAAGNMLTLMAPVPGGAVETALASRDVADAA